MSDEASESAATGPAAMAAVVMGVSGCGKTEVGRRAASSLGWAFIEGDALHPPANVAKMSAGVPLEDDDRRPWLDAVAAAVRDEAAAGRCCIVACSALRRRYRDRVGRGAGGRLLFVHLRASFETIHRRMAARTDHFMKPAMLASQFETLEPLRPDEPGVVVDASRPVGAVADEVVAALRSAHARSD